MAVGLVVLIASPPVLVRLLPVLGGLGAALVAGVDFADLQSRVHQAEASSRFLTGNVGAGIIFVGAAVAVLAGVALSAQR